MQRARGWRALLRALNNINISWLSAAFTTWRATAQAVCQQMVQVRVTPACIPRGGPSTVRWRYEMYGYPPIIP